MKKILIIVSLFGIINNSLVAQFNGLLGLPDVLIGVKKTINSGNHNCWPFSLEKAPKLHIDRRYKFRAHFYDNCHYFQHELEKGDGWSKLGKITNRVFAISDSTEDCFKMLVGWRMTDDMQLKLALFFHQDYKWVAHQIHELDFSGDANFSSDLYFSTNVLGLIIQDESSLNALSKCLGIRQSNQWCDSRQLTILRKSFYFGGMSTAPHKMEMRFHDQEVDFLGYQTKFNSNDIMTWNLSEFNDDDNFEYVASTEINGSIRSSDKYIVVNYRSNHPNKEYQKCIIHDGAEISFTAGKKVHLYHGFHAKPGSYFKAVIEPPAMININQIPQQFDEQISYSVENVKSVELSLYIDPTLDSVVYGKQFYVNPRSSIAKTIIDTILPLKKYYAVANFYSGKGSQKRVEGWVTNNRYNDRNSLDNTLNIYNSYSCSIYPNPTVGVFNIRLKNFELVYSIKVLNTKGQVVFNTSKPNNAINIIDISNQVKGIYIILVQTNVDVETYKLVKN